MKHIMIDIVGNEARRSPDEIFLAIKMRNTHYFITLRAQPFKTEPFLKVKINKQNKLTEYPFLVINILKYVIT